MDSKYLDTLFSAKRFSDIHQAVSFISRFDSPKIFAEFNKILNDISPNDELFLRNLLHIVDEYPHKIDMLISSLAMYSYSTEISDFQNTLNILRRYITHIPKNNEDYTSFLHNIEQVDFSDENEIQKFILTNKIKNDEPEEITEKKRNPLDFLKKFPLVNIFNKIITKNKSSEEGTFVPIKSDEPSQNDKSETDKTEVIESKPLIADDTESGYDAYKSMIERIGYEESVVADEIISPIQPSDNTNDTAKPSTDSLLQEETEEDTFVSLRADNGDDGHYQPISLTEDAEIIHNAQFIIHNDKEESAAVEEEQPTPTVEPVETAAAEETDTIVQEIEEPVEEPFIEEVEEPTLSVEPVETAAAKETDTIVSEIEEPIEEPVITEDQAEEQPVIEKSEQPIVEEQVEQPVIEEQAAIEEETEESIIEQEEEQLTQSVEPVETAAAEETDTIVQEIEEPVEEPVIIEEQAEEQPVIESEQPNVEEQAEQPVVEEQTDEPIIKQEEEQPTPSVESVETAAVEETDTIVSEIEEPIEEPVITEDQAEEQPVIEKSEQPIVEEQVEQPVIEEQAAIEEQPEELIIEQEEEQPTLSIEPVETSAVEEEILSDDNLSGIAEEKTSSEVFSSAIPNPISLQRIEYRNRIIQALLDVYHDKKTGYKLMLGLFRGLDVFRRMCLTGEEFNKELFMRNFRKYLTHFPDANLITLCHEKVPDIDETIISQHIIGCMKILNHHVDKTRFKLLFEDKLNLRSGFNWEYQQRITWLYFPEKRKPKRDIDEIYAIKSVTDSTAAKTTENSKVKKYRSYISMLSNRDITLANQILGVLHTIYYKRRDCKRFLFHVFKSLDEYDLSAFELTPKQKAIFESNFNKTVLNTNKNPNYPNLFKMIVQNIPKIKPREIESLLPICIRIMKEKIDIGFERKKRKQPDLSDSFNPLEKYSQIYEKKLFVIYKTV